MDGEGQVAQRLSQKAFRERVLAENLAGWDQGHLGMEGRGVEVGGEGVAGWRSFPAWKGRGWGEWKFYIASR